MIYPLEHTNVALSGQIKFDIYLKKDDMNIYTTDLKISPVSENVPFSYENGVRDILKSHKYNLKKMRTLLGDMFYETYPNINSNYFLPNRTDVRQKFDCQYEAGFRRAPYKKYGKQMMFFLPLWIEKKEDLDDLFEGLCIGINGYEEPIVFSEDMKNYFTDWFDFKKDKKEQDEQFLMNIDLSKYTAFIYGTDIEDGIDKKVDISDIVKTLRDRERPLIEQNNLLTSQFKANHLIVKQLVNLNFVFDPYDIVNELIGPKVGEELNVDVIYKENNKKVPYKDFYFNNCEIPQLVFNEPFELTKVSNETIFQNTKEDLVYDFALVNKIAPTIVNWSCLLTEPRFFNLCSEFAYDDKNGNKSELPLFASNFANQNDTLFNNIYNFCKVGRWPVGDDGEQLDFNLVKSTLELSIGKMDSAEFKGTNVQSSFSTRIDKDYIYRGNKIAGIGSGKYEEIRFRILVYESEEQLFQMCKAESADGVKLVKTLIISTETISHLINFKSFTEMLEIADSAFEGWYEKVVDANKFKTFVMKKSISSKIHPCSNKDLVAYDLYKNDHTHIVLRRFDGNIYPLLIDANDELLYNKYYIYRTESETNSGYFGQHLWPNYRKDDKFYLFNSLTRAEYLDFCKGIIECPMLGTGETKLKYLLPEYDFVIGYNEGFSKENPLKPIDYLKVNKQLGEYAEYYDFEVLSLDEKLEDNIIKYKYKVKYTLK